jgi:hypothetical protein
MKIPISNIKTAICYGVALLVLELTAPGLCWFNSHLSRRDATGAGKTSASAIQKGGEKVNTNQTSDDIDLTLIELPQLGTHNGVFVDVIPGNRVDKRGRKDKTLTLVIEIDQSKSDKSLFTVQTRYVLNARGERKLRLDAQSLDPSLSAEALKRFNPAKFFVAKACQVTVSHATENGRTVGRAAKYQAAGETKLTPSGKYARSDSATSAAETSKEVSAPSPAPAPATA